MENKEEEKVVIHNPTVNDIKDYPISLHEGGETKLWSILSGETLSFPSYVGEYLLSVYKFLQRVLTQEQYDARIAEEQAKAEGKVYPNIKVVDSQGKEVPPPSTQPGFTTQNSIPNSEPVQPVSNVPPVEDVSSPPVSNASEPEDNNREDSFEGKPYIIAKDGKVHCNLPTCDEKEKGFASVDTYRAHFGVKHSPF